MIPKQGSFLSLSQNKKTLRCEKFLTEMNQVIPWNDIIAELSEYYTESDTGRPKTDLILLLKIYFLQQWYNLSDPGAEEAIYDRNSFQKFLRIDLIADSIPDETTILNFRHFLEKHELQKDLFHIVNELLEKQGLLMTNGTIVDATIIAAPSSTKNKSKKRDPEMSSTKKGNQWHFGMKAHIGVDAQSGLVHSIEGTASKVHDRTPLPDLLHGKERAIFGDKAYGKKSDKQRARMDGVFWGITDRGVQNHPLSSSQRRRNKKLSSIRAKVEHPFQILKCQWGHTKVRYRGLRKNTLQLNALFALSNLFMVRKALLSTA
jgi:transposase, IS5 family